MMLLLRDGARVEVAVPSDLHVDGARQLQLLATETDRIPASALACWSDGFELADRFQRVRLVEMWVPAGADVCVHGEIEKKGADAHRLRDVRHIVAMDVVELRRSQRRRALIAGASSAGFVGIGLGLLAM